MTCGEIIQSSLSIHGRLVLGHPPSSSFQGYQNLQMLKSFMYNGVGELALHIWLRTYRQGGWPILWPKNLKNIRIIFITN